MTKPLWVFGYGSLVWRPAFPFAERAVGTLAGHARRFWQGSTDHRGVPGAPGRVVTIVPEAGERCAGVVFRVAEAERAGVLRALDRRERGGFARRELPVALRGGGEVAALVYVADPDNPNYLGPAPLAALARQVRDATGPSGTNVEYVLRLAEALRAIDAVDAHVEELARLVS